MKIKNLVLTKIDESNVTASFDIVKADGTLVLHVENRGFTSQADTIAKAKDEIKQSIRNIRDNEAKKQASKLSKAFEFLLGQETDIEA